MTAVQEWKEMSFFYSWFFVDFMDCLPACLQMAKSWFVLVPVWVSIFPGYNSLCIDNTAASGALD